MSDTFVLAQFGRKIELVQLPRESLSPVGTEFDRMPAKERESWTTVKVFDSWEERHLTGLEKLIGLAALKNLFYLELPEEKTPEQVFRETVSRMGGEA